MRTRSADRRHGIIVASLLAGIAILLVTQDLRGVAPVVLIVSALLLAVIAYWRGKPRRSSEANDEPF
jgi:hypothetical protein